MSGTTSDVQPVHEHTFSETDLEEPFQLKDPAQVAVALLIDHALEAAGTNLVDAGADDLVVAMTSPDTSWIGLALHDWQQRARGGTAPMHVTDRAWGDRGPWTCWTYEEPPRPSVVKEVGHAFALAVAAGNHCAAVVGDLAWLPVDVRRAIDLSLVLPRLNGHDVGVIAQKMTGSKPKLRLKDEQAAALTPSLLRWGRRRRQSADAYIGKLAALLQADAQEAKAKAPAPREQPTLDRLHGMDEAVAWGHAVARDLELFRRGKISWADVDRGCLLSGPPGCGKTLYVRALAATCGATLITGSYGQWLGSGTGHQGDLLKSMRKSFSDARAAAPAILFIDEVDSFPNRGTVTHHFADWEIQVVNALLAEIDGVEGRQGVILVAACNHPEKLDPALIRSGRLDRHIRVRLPDRGALAGILREHLGDDLQGEDLDGPALAAGGVSGADCERLVRGARRRARTAQRSMVLGDLLDEIGGTEERSADEIWRAAVHEAGHAVVAATLHPGCLDRVSVQADSTSGGATSAHLRPKVYKLPTDIQDELTMLLAGRAAEEEILGVASSGSGGLPLSDLARATSLAVEASLALGLDDIGGLLWRGSTDIRDLRVLLTTDRLLAERVRGQLDEAYELAKAAVRRQITAVKAIASELLKRPVIEGAEVEALIFEGAR